MSDGEDGAGAPPVRVKEIHKAWTVIDPGTNKNEEKDYLAMGLLYQAIPESLIMQIGDVDSSMVLWESIKARYVGADRVKEARLQTLNAEFDRLKMMESETIDAYAGKLSGIASKSAALGEIIDELKLVKKFLKTLPRSKFIHIVASLEQVLDLKSVGFEDVVGRLKAYEERIKEEDADENDQSRVLFVKLTGDGGVSSSGGTGASRLQSGAKGKGAGGSDGYSHNNGSGSGGSNGPKSNKSLHGNKHNSSSQAQ
ncbi:uncharacterized protein LOC128126174 [Lactuca sativa]|uniref:uncharacterized protein LOC128126174 n=1 Tax=Lactuca sativa TaxID=4236 RepID=UPI000CD82600|nr:uncharacterized protein LOC128126174 [Lactuca sativa]